jgi:hypothetical protein
VRVPASVRVYEGVSIRIREECVYVDPLFVCMRVRVCVCERDSTLKKDVCVARVSAGERARARARVGVCMIDKVLRARKSMSIFSNSFCVQERV